MFQVVSTKTKKDDDVKNIVKSDQRCLLREGHSVVNEESSLNTDVKSDTIISSSHSNHTENFITEEDQGELITLLHHLHRQLQHCII